MSLLSKIFKPRKKTVRLKPVASLTQLASAGPLIRGEVYTKKAGYFGCELEGNFRASAEVWIEPSCNIKGNLEGTYFSIEGTIHGNITATGEVILKPKATVEGNIHANALILEPGTKFNGLLIIGGTEKELALNLKSK